MKNIGLGILIIGVGLAASYGARLSPEMRTSMAIAGKAKIAGAAAKEAKGAYCKAREAAKLKISDGCPDPEADKVAAEAQKNKSDEEKAADRAKAKEAAIQKAKAAATAPKPDRATLIAKGEAKITALKKTDEQLDEKIATLRRTWIDAEAAAVLPGVDAKLAPTPPPGERVGSWFAESGVPFLGGLFLVVVGAIIGRRAVRAEASGDQASSSGEAVDFGTLLSQLTHDMRALADSMGEAPEQGQSDIIREQIEAFQFEAFAPIVASRMRIQVRFGLANFAELFSPFSSAERRSNRAWSALVDNHWPEARASLQIAAAQLEEAKAILDRLLAAA